MRRAELQLAVIVIYKRGFPKTRGTILGGPHNKDYSILGGPN